MQDVLEKITSPLLRQLEARGSVRNYRPDPVPDEMVQAIIEAGCRAPSSCNQESYSIIVVRDLETRRRLAELGGGQPQMLKAPVFLAFCADLRRVARGCAKLGQPFAAEPTLDMWLASTIDAALVGMCASLAAESLGLGTCMIGAIRNDVIETARLLGLPPKVYAVYGLTVGWAVAPPAAKPRFRSEDVVHEERYRSLNLNDAVDDYDAKLAEFYHAYDPTMPDKTWSRRMVNRFAVVPRPDMRAELNALGFELL